MKALAVRQPWASAIIAGAKTVENRSWRTRYRGPLAIVASGTPARLDQDDIRLLEADGVSLDLRRLSCVLGIVTLTDIVPISEISQMRYAEGPWCWVLSDPRPLATPVPFRASRLGLFEVAFPQTENPQ